MSLLNWVRTSISLLKGKSVVITLDDTRVQYIKGDNISKKQAMLVALKTAEALNV